MRRAFAIALAALAAAPWRGEAQWRPAPMVVPAPAGAEVLPGRFDPAVTVDELLLVDPATGAAVRRPHGALLSSTVWPYALPAGTPIRAGSTRASNADALSEVVYSLGTPPYAYVRYGSTPATEVGRARLSALTSFAHPLPHAGDTFAYTSPDLGSGLGWIALGDDEAASSLGGTQLGRTWLAEGLGALETGAHEVFGIPLSPAAIALGIDDLAIPTGGGVFLLAHRPPAPDLRYAATPVDLYELQLSAVAVGGPSPLARPPWLPPSIPLKGDALGAAAVDVDGDGLRDLVFSYGSTLEVPDGAGGLLANHLVAVRGTGDPLDLAAGAWEDVTALPALGLRDPVVLRRIAVEGQPGAAVWDRGADAIVVFWSEGGVLRTWRGLAAGRRIRDIEVADVVGTSAPDLVAVGEDVLVFPDIGRASPVLTWSPGSPGAPVRGEDHLLSVWASDPDGLTLEWFFGDPYGAPDASSAVAAGAGQQVDRPIAGALLCAPPPQTLAVTVRATDAFGVFAELSAALPVAAPPPSLALSGALPGGALPLPPGGTTATFEGSALAGCGTLVFTWGGTIFDAATAVVEEGTATTARRIVTLGEASYPQLLASDADATLLVTEQPSGVVSPLVVLALDLDAGDLVEVDQTSDLPALAAGEVAVLRTTIRSRLGTALPGVRLVDVLAGLAPAGPPRAEGALVVSVDAGGAEVVLDALPASGAEVVVDLPVRSTGGRGASSVEVRSSGGHLLTPAAQAGTGEGTTPGCGCGGPGAGAGALLALVLAALAPAARPRRRER